MARGNLFNVRVSDAERDDLDKAKDLCGFAKVSEFIRFAAEMVAQGQWQPPAPATEQPRPARP
jgi:hypothetical protein